LFAGEAWLSHGFGGRYSSAWPPQHAAAAQQVHGDVVLRPSGLGACGEGDALIAAQPGLWVGVRTADCVPILLADRQQRCVAAVHAGWRGTVAGIAAKALAALASNPADVLVAIGPAIGVCCYEVGDEVARQFGRSGRVHLDLAAENRAQMLAAGVPASQIAWGAPCTRCDGDFHSFRRDGVAAGRMVSAIVVV